MRREIYTPEEVSNKLKNWKHLANWERRAVATSRDIQITRKLTEIAASKWESNND